jgi:hypothetical protein
MPLPIGFQGIRSLLNKEKERLRGYPDDQQKGAGRHREHQERAEMIILRLRCTTGYQSESHQSPLFTETPDAIFDVIDGGLDASALGSNDSGTPISATNQELSH